MNLDEKKQIKELTNGGSFHPILIKDEPIKELCGYDWAALRYAGADYIRTNAEAFGILDACFCQIDEEAAIQDDRLYIGGFEGYSFGDNEQYVLHCFSFSAAGRLLAYISEHDEQGNEKEANWYLMD